MSHVFVLAEVNPALERIRDHPVGRLTAARLNAVATRSTRSRQTGCGLTRDRAVSTREAIEGSEAKVESGERRSRVT